MLHALAPEVVFFDLDDTIVRFTAGQPDTWAWALQQHATEHALQPLLQAVHAESEEFWRDAERAFWGRQNMYAARRLVAERALARHGVERAVSHRIADAMTDAKESAMRPFEGAVETLEELASSGVRMALLTNGCSVFQRRKVARFGLERFFDLILIEGELGYGKPDRRVFERALAHFAVPAAGAVMVGDNLEADIAGAQAVGIRGVWHDCYGTGAAAERAKPAYVITSVVECRAWARTSGRG
jgi:putative hydrolase of the HAD superfamily